MVSLIISILVIGIVVGLLFWLINFIGSQFPQIPAPFLAVAKVLLIVVAVLYLISLLLPLASSGGGSLKL